LKIGTYVSKKVATYINFNRPILFRRRWRVAPRSHW